MAQLKYRPVGVDSPDNRLGAEEIMRDWLDTLPPYPEDIIIEPEGTREIPHGWVVRITTRRFLETGNVRHAIIGPRDYIVARSDGSVWSTSPHCSLDENIAEFERICTRA